MTHLLLAYDFPPLSGGISRWVAELALRYPPGEVVVSTGPYDDDTTIDAPFPNRIDRIDYPRRRLRTVPGVFRWTRRVYQLAKETDASFIWSANLKPPGYPAYYVERKLGIPYGLILHGTDVHQLRQHTRRRHHKRMMARRLLGSAAVLVTNSDWTRDLTLGLLEEIKCPYRPEDVQTVKLGTDPTHFRPGVDTSAVRAKYGLKGDKWIVTIARLFAHKGQDVAIRALAQLRDSEPDLQYAVVGRGPHEPQLRALVAELRLEDRVHFLQGVPDSDLPALYNLGNVYVGPSRYVDVHVEGFGISFVEASACGVPVVGGKTGGVPDAIIEGTTGFLVDPEDVNAVATTVQKILRDTELAKRLGAEGRKAVETFYNWDRVTQEMRSIAERYAGATSK